VEADPQKLTDAVFASVDDETIEMLVGPAQRSLRRGVQIGDGAAGTVDANGQSAPDQRADAAQ